MVPPNFYCTRNTKKNWSKEAKEDRKTAVVVLPGTVGAAADLVLPAQDPQSEASAIAVNWG